ncbi:MAG: hypothetical protein L0H79_12390 [Intrasporangium sp.]|uniref:hypothetical protein n=1 Tax=Intrasporangium sp. TaxID=1925024 RepID=UPI0026490B77|nr:hypothetical protein [Intrasporangium sp.]MDN5796538.1 hypothetical protein [Intrasporangium sp.]
MSTITTPGTVRTTEPPSLLTVAPGRTAGRPLDPEARRDLLVDRLVDRLTAGRAEYQLDDWLTTLVSAPDVAYRHEIFTDLQTTAVREGLTEFSVGLQHVRRILAMAAKLYYRSEQRRWFLQVARDYVTTVRALAGTLGVASLGSTALRGLASWVDGYVASPGFHALSAEANELIEQFDEIRYRVRVHGDWVQVRPVDPDEPELASRVLATFDRFRQEAPKSYLQQIRDPGAMDHVEAAIASFVARLNPDVFASLGVFCSRHQPLVPPALDRVERELQFYLAYLDVMAATASPGVTWSLPEIAVDRELSVKDGFDIVMVLGGSTDMVVPGDCRLADDERLVVITGPNQGGKTTFARMLGQLHLLARPERPCRPAVSGCPSSTRSSRSSSGARTSRTCGGTCTTTWSAHMPCWSRSHRRVWYC